MAEWVPTCHSRPAHQCQAPQHLVSDLIIVEKLKIRRWYEGGNDRCGSSEYPPCWSGSEKTILSLSQVLCALSAEAAGHPWPATQLEERPEPKGTEDSRDPAPGHGQPSAAGKRVAFPAFAEL